MLIILSHVALICPLLIILCYPLFVSSIIDAETGQMQDRMEARQDGDRKFEREDRSNAGQDGCRT